MKIWIMNWTTETGNWGISGYWDKKPTPKQLKGYIKERFPDDFAAKTFYHELVELDKLTL